MTVEACHLVYRMLLSLHNLRSRKLSAAVEDNRFLDELVKNMQLNSAIPSRFHVVFRMGLFVTFCFTF